jgi:hypothetical protein
MRSLVDIVSANRRVKRPGANLNDGCCTKCGSPARIVTYRARGASGTRIPSPEARVCAACEGQRVER